MIGKPHPLRRHLVEVGSLQHFLAVTSKVSISQIIGENVDDVGALRILPIALMPNKERNKIVNRTEKRVIFVVP